MNKEQGREKDEGRECARDKRQGTKKKRKGKIEKHCR